jgi:hypothetical protein
MVPTILKSVEGILLEGFLGAGQVRLESASAFTGFQGAGPEWVRQLARLVIEDFLGLHRRQGLQRLLTAGAGLGHEGAQIGELVLGAPRQ